MKKYFNFNRHELMSDEMRDVISASNRVLIFEDNEISNMISGLYDGFYYYKLKDQLEQIKKDLSSEKIEYTLVKWTAIVSLLHCLSIIKEWEA